MIIGSEIRNILHAPGDGVRSRINNMVNLLWHFRLVYSGFKFFDDDVYRARLMNSIFFLPKFTYRFLTPPYSMRNTLESTS